MNEQQAREQIEIIREFNWNLSAKGFEFRSGAVNREMHHNHRLHMTEGFEVEQFIRARRFLSYFQPYRTVRLTPFSTYGWKHLAEDWTGAYVANGMFIAAAKSLGFMVRQTPGTPNGRMNLGKPAWIAAERINHARRTAVLTVMAEALA